MGRFPKSDDAAVSLGPPTEFLSSSKTRRKRRNNKEADTPLKKRISGSSSKNNEKQTRKSKIEKRERSEHQLSLLTKASSVISIISILILAIVCNFKDLTKNDRKIVQREILSVDDYLRFFICQNHRDGYCHTNLNSAPDRRTHNVTTPGIKSGEIILRLPRDRMILDLDALRDPWIRSRNLLDARHPGTDDTLDVGAFLAVFLVRYYDAASSATEKRLGDMQPFYNILPDFESLSQTHPTLFSDDYLINGLGFHRDSSTYQIIRSFQEMMQSEYTALSNVAAASKASIDFLKVISREKYFAMRINVISRSFRAGSISDYKASTAELDVYDKNGLLGQLKKGCRAMSPILDMWDHHPNPNVEWRHDPNHLAFTIRASKGGIKAGKDIIVSYGTYTESHLFAKFGFVNGDGSAWTEVDLSVFHNVSNMGLLDQFSHGSLDKEVTGGENDADLSIKMLNYLQYDDGYDECIDDTEISTLLLKSSKSEESSYFKSLSSHFPLQQQLKLLKAQLLANIADDNSSWIIRLQPRNPEAQPPRQSSFNHHTHVPKFDPNRIKFDGSKLISTCRLITLTEHDFDGEALNVLKEFQLSGEKISIQRQTSALEYRALGCMVRLITLSLAKYEERTSIKKLIGKLSLKRGEEDGENNEQNKSKFTFQSHMWYASHVLLGEMQTLKALQSITSSGVSQMQSQLKDENRKGNIHKSGLQLRSRPCTRVTKK